MFSNLRAGLLSALGRFPLVLLCGWIGTAAAIAAAANQSSEEDYPKYLRIGLTAALGMPLFFSLHMLGERGKRGMRLAAPLAGILLLAACYHWLIPPRSDVPRIAGIRLWLVFAALHCFAAISAHLGGPEDNCFWQFNWRIFLRFCLATLYSAVLLAGLELALFIGCQLFELPESKGYLYLVFLMAGCFQPVFFLSGVPRDFAALEADAEYPRALKSFAQFTLAPAAAIYAAILYAYAIKMILAGNWPRGFVAMPMFILACAGILCSLLLHPLRSQRDEKWARWFCKNFPRALAPLSLLLLLSVWERIAAYGVTEERYFGVVFGFWIVAWALVYMIRQDAGIRWIPASLAVICLASAFGPWSAGAISRDSQYQRLTKQFGERGLMIAHEFNRPRETLELPAKETGMIRSIIKYLVSRHGGESVHRLFGGILKNADWPKLAVLDADQRIWPKLNLRTSGGDEARLSYALKPDDVEDIEGFRQVSFLYVFDVKGMQTHDALTLHDGALWMKTPDEARAERLPMDAFLKSLPQGQGKPLNSSQLTLDWTQKGHPFRIVFIHLSLRREAGEPPRIEFCQCMLYEQ